MIAIVINSIVLILSGFPPPAMTPRVEDANDAVRVVAAVRSPKSIAFP